MSSNTSLGVAIGGAQNRVLRSRGKGRRSLKIVADVADEQVKGMVEEVVKELGGLDLMIADAGICRVGTLLETDLANWEANFAVSVTGTFLCFKYAAQQMVAQGRGGRLVGHANQIAYYTRSTVDLSPSSNPSVVSEQI